MPTRIPLLLSLLVFPLLAEAHNCSPARYTKKYKDLVALNYCEFDQTKGGGWQSMNTPRCQALAMEDFLRAHGPKLQDLQKASVLIHLAHAYAMSNDDGRSLATLKRIKSFSNVPGDLVLFIQAQIAYMNHDKGFEALRVQLRDTTGLCSEKSACGGKGPDCDPKGTSSYYGPVERLKDCFDDKPRSLRVMWESSITCHGNITITGSLTPTSSPRVCIR